jgi:hypothetical protein
MISMRRQQTVLPISESVMNDGYEVGAITTGTCTAGSSGGMASRPMRTTVALGFASSWHRNTLRQPDNGVEQNGHQRSCLPTLLVRSKVISSGGAFDQVAVAHA